MNADDAYHAKPIVAPKRSMKLRVCAIIGAIAVLIIVLAVVAVVLVFLVFRHNPDLNTGCGSICPPFHENCVQPSGTRDTKTVDMSTKAPFHSVLVKDCLDAELTPSTTDAVVFEADKAFLPYLKIKKDGQKLIVGIEGKVPAKGVFLVCDNCKVVVRISAKYLDEIELAGSGSLKTMQKFDSRDHFKASMSGSGEMTAMAAAPQTTTLELSGSGAMTAVVTSNMVKAEASGSGSADITVTTSNINGDVSGSGTMVVKGTTLATNAVLKASGSGSLDAQQCEAMKASARVSGSGDVSVWARDTLDATVSGSGSIYFYGSPKVTKHVTGSGDVVHKP